ncbi:MAG: hypothetical protein KKB62_00415 [Nanoarchaeota archaeon]|nr:hypothetical protein [Nanoarchaeota archaeon]
MKFERENFLNFIGWFLILLAVLNISFKIYYGFGHEVIWLCNNAPIVIGIGILLRNQKIVLGTLALLFLGSLSWNLESAYLLIFGKTLFGGGDPFWGMNLILKIGTITNHSMTLLLSLVAVFLINKKEKFAWAYGLAYGIILVSLAFIYPERNYNCILEPCMGFIPNFKFYTVAYILFYLTFFMIPFTWIINKFMKN